MATKKKMVPVTSVTPASKVKAVSKAQQARTRNLVMGIASATPVGRIVKGTATAAKTVSKARAGYQVSSKTAKKIGDKLSGTTSKKVQDKLHKIAMNDADQTAKYNKDLDAYGAYAWSKHPAMVSRKGFEKAVNKGKTVTDRQSVRYRKAEDKAIAAANARGLKAANQPTKASKTFIGNNNKISPRVRRDIIVNETSPARPNRERGGSLNTLRKQGKTSPTPARKKSK